MNESQIELGARTHLCVLLSVTSIAVEQVEAEGRRWAPGIHSGHWSPMCARALAEPPWYAKLRLPPPLWIVMAVRKFGSPLATCDVGHHRDAAQWWGIHATVGAHAEEGAVVSVLWTRGRELWVLGFRSMAPSSVLFERKRHAVVGSDWMDEICWT
jgi:hypothetical protein